MRRRRDNRGDRALEARERQALEIHDNLVQGLTAIHWALEAGAYAHARELTAAALVQAQGMIGDLLQDHPEGHAFAPGALRRQRAAWEPVEPVGAPRAGRTHRLAATDS